MKIDKNIVLVLTWVLLGLAIFGIYFAPSVTPVPIVKSFAQFPVNVDGWGSTGKRASEYLVATLGADDILLRQFQDAAGNTGELYMAYFTFTKGKKCPHAPQLCWAGAGWMLKDLGEESIPTSSAKNPSVAVRKIIAEKDGNRVLLLYTYKLNDRYIADLMRFRAASVIDSIFKRKNCSFTLQLSCTLDAGNADTKEKAMKSLLSKVLSLTEKEYLP